MPHATGAEPLPQLLDEVPLCSGDDLTSSPIPLVPEDAPHDVGLSGIGSPYRRVSAPDAEPTVVSRHG